MSSLPPATISPVHDNVRAIPLPRPSTALKRPGSPAPVAAPRGVETVEAPDTDAASQGSQPRVREIVVPVKLPPDARYEIVIRLQLDTTT